MTASYQQPDAERCVKSMKRSGKLAVALVAAILGVILLVLGSRGGKKAETVTPPSPSQATPSVEEYRQGLETRMEALCGCVEGVGTVRVEVMLEGGYEYVYATDKKITSGGETTSFVIVGSGDEERLVYLTERPPAILGIGVVCTGGGDPEVKREITALLSATFGVGSNKIYVTGHK
ncbi:MAG: hypothetical protein IJD38_00315 [Clostridia bacterium]|nr:hypothetical protein [Clostridia bacterium]